MDNVIHKRETAVRRSLRTLARIAGSLGFSLSDRVQERPYPGADFHWYGRDIE